MKQLSESQIKWLRTHVKGFAEIEEVTNQVRASTQEYRKLLTKETP